MAETAHRASQHTKASINRRIAEDTERRLAAQAMRGDFDEPGRSENAHRIIEAVRH